MFQLHISCICYIVQTSLIFKKIIKDSSKVSSGSTVVPWFSFCPFQLMNKFSAHGSLFKYKAKNLGAFYGDIICNVEYPPY
jgi:hypothetical protein